MLAMTWLLGERSGGHGRCIGLSLEAAEGGVRRRSVGSIAVVGKTVEVYYCKPESVKADHSQMVDHKMD